MKEKNLSGMYVFIVKDDNCILSRHKIQLTRATYQLTRHKIQLTRATYQLTRATYQLTRHKYIYRLFTDIYARL